MSKFKINDRVSFFYFGDRKKGTVIGHWPVDNRDDGNGMWRVSIDNPLSVLPSSQVCVAEKTMKKLKPKKKRRECWVVYGTQGTEIFCAVKTELEAANWDRKRFLVVHMKEVRG